jgi:response regulator RpfG family c-di-GMP phosphodiesterase
LVAEKEKHFDPHLVDLLIDNLAIFEKIKSTYEDK